MSSLPMVSIVIPARNEAAHIARCIERIGHQDYPAHRMEVVVVDGASTDGTDDAAKGALANLDVARAEVVTNPVSSTPSNLNVGLAWAAGEILCRVDARSLVPPDYVARLVAVLTSRSDVAVAGGAQVAVAPHPTATGEGIARALNNRWAMGLSRYRRGAASGPADTVYLGAFRVAELRGVRGWDERLPTNQDFDLNRRLSATGTVWFEGGLEVDYIPRSTVGDVFRQYRRFGQWKVRYWRLTGDRPQARQVALMVPPPAMVTIGLGAVLASRRRGRVLALGLAGAVLGLLAVDDLGGPDDAAPDWHVRAAAVATLAAVGGGWSFGLWDEFLRRRR